MKVAVLVVTFPNLSVFTTMLLNDLSKVIADLFNLLNSDTA